MLIVDQIADIPADRPVFIYGAGRAGRALRRALEQAGRHDVCGFVQTERTGGETGIIAVDELPRHRSRAQPERVLIASQWFEQIATVLHLCGIPPEDVVNTWFVCRDLIEEEDRESTFDYYFRTYGRFDLLPPQRARYVLLGDSFGYHLGWRHFFTNAAFADRSVPGIHACHLDRLLPYCFALKPAFIFLLAGWVDLTSRVRGLFPALTDQMQATCQSILEQGVRPVLISQIPMSINLVGATRGPGGAAVFNRCVGHYNQVLSAWGTRNQTGFIDAARLLCDDQGLMERFAAKDGAHLNRAAAHLVVEAVAAYLAEAGERPPSPEEPMDTAVAA